MDVIINLFITYIYKPSANLVTIIAKNPIWLIGLVLFVIGMAVLSNESRIKGQKTLSQFFSFTSTVAIILLALSSYSWFSSYIDSIPSKSHEEQQGVPSNTNTKTPSGSTPSAPTLTYTRPKQLYYSVSCSTCWSDACNHNGYSYGGYDSYWYTYYANLCQSCRCNNYKAQSFWK